MQRRCSVCMCRVWKQCDARMCSIKQRTILPHCSAVAVEAEPTYELCVTHMHADNLSCGMISKTLHQLLPGCGVHSLGWADTCSKFTHSSFTQLVCVQANLRFQGPFTQPDSPCCDTDTCCSRFVAALLQNLHQVVSGCVCLQPEMS